ncbi:MAG: glycosyltransferase family 2 protein [Patescibacteria group bacterium]
MSSDLYPVSVIVHTKNSESTLNRCLDSVSFAQEIIVVDMQSNDQSKKIAEKYTDHIFSVKNSGYVETVRNFGIEKATQDWVFILDADEELSEGLKIWMQSFLSSSKSDTDVSAYYIPRKNIMFGQEVRHTGWWPDYQLRFFQKGAVKWAEEIHSQPIASGKVVHLPADPEKCLIHYNYKSVEQFVERMNRYTTIAANESKQKKTLSSTELMNAFASEFCQRLFAWDGTKDGSLGLSLSFLQGMYQFIVKMKQWETNRFLEKKETEIDTVLAINSFKNILSYWVADWHIKNSRGFAKIGWIIRRKLSK